MLALPKLPLAASIAKLPHPFPYWATERYYPNRFEMKPTLRLEAWQHPDQTGEAVRPDGHEVLRFIEAKLLHRAISMKTLQYYELHPEERPLQFREIEMYAWIDVFRPAYPIVPIDSRRPNLFVPMLTAGPNPKIGWRDLNTGFTCMDYIPLRRKS